jgi:AcrR family transcriptional regulator
VTRRSAEVRLDGLLRSACDVIVERGLANTRTADVASAAGVSQALVFYHFGTKEGLLAQALAWAAELELKRLESLMDSTAAPLEKLRKILKWYEAKPRSMWLDCWAESVRVPELEKVSRRLDLRWRDALTEVIETGVKGSSPATTRRRGLADTLGGRPARLTTHPRSSRADNSPARYA